MMWIYQNWFHLRARMKAVISSSRYKRPIKLGQLLKVYLRVKKIKRLLNEIGAVVN